MEDVRSAGATASPAIGLTQTERVINTFIAPSKTFNDILRSSSWWLPFLLILIVTAASAFAVDKKIGFEAVAEHTIQQNSKAAEQMAQLTPDQRAKQMSIATVFTKE